MQRDWITITVLESSRKQSWRQDLVVTTHVRAASPMHGDAGQKGSEARGDRAVSGCTAQLQTQPQLRVVLRGRQGFSGGDCGPRPRSHLLYTLALYFLVCQQFLQRPDSKSDGRGERERERRRSCTTIITSW